MKRKLKEVVKIIVTGFAVCLIAAALFGALIWLLSYSLEDGTRRHTKHCQEIVDLAGGRDLKVDGSACYFIKDNKLIKVDPLSS